MPHLMTSDVARLVLLLRRERPEYVGLSKKTQKIIFIVLGVVLGIIVLAFLTCKISPRYIKRRNRKAKEKEARARAAQALQRRQALHPAEATPENPYPGEAPPDYEPPPKYSRTG